MQDFLAKPDMTWGYEGIGDTSGRKRNGGDSVTAQLLSIEAMHNRGFLQTAEAEAAKLKVLGLPKL